MESIVGKLLYIFSRLREPSTHAAISALLLLIGQKIPDETWNTVVNGGAVIFGILGVFFKEAKPETKVDGF
jgi:hypothetical protein